MGSDAQPKADKDRKLQSLTPGQIHQAASDGDLQKLRELTTLAPDMVDEPNERGWYPLHLASEAGHCQAVELLVQSKANVDPRDQVKETPLHKATCSLEPEVAQVLIKLRARVDATAVGNKTSLHMAALAGSVDIAELLLKNKADVNALTHETADQPASTPLALSLAVASTKTMRYSPPQAAKLADMSVAERNNELQNMSPADRAAALASLSPERRREALLDFLSDSERASTFDAMTSQETAAFLCYEVALLLRKHGARDALTGTTSESVQQKILSLTAASDQIHATNGSFWDCRRGCE